MLLEDLKASEDKAAIEIACDNLLNIQKELDESLRKKGTPTPARYAEAAVLVASLLLSHMTV